MPVPGPVSQLTGHTIRQLPRNPTALAVRAIVARLSRVADRLSNDAVEKMVVVRAAKLAEPLVEGLQKHSSPLRTNSGGNLRATPGSSDVVSGILSGAGP